MSNNQTLTATMEATTNASVFGEYQHVVTALGFDISKQPVSTLKMMLGVKVKMGNASQDEQALLKLLNDETGGNISAWFKRQAFSTLDWIEDKARAGKVALAGQQFVDTHTLWKAQKAYAQETLQPIPNAPTAQKERISENAPEIVVTNVIPVP